MKTKAKQTTNSDNSMTDWGLSEYSNNLQILRKIDLTFASNLANVHH